MVFWIVAAALTLAASLAVLVPLTRARANATDDATGHDVEVYRDQLQEVERDAARGLIEPSQAEQAKAEITRRLIKASTVKGERSRRSGGTVRLAGMVGVLAVPLVSWGLYVSIGMPGLPGEPLAERMARNPAQSTVEELIARAERHLVENPNDERGWEVLAPVYMRQQRFADAATAWRNAIGLAGSDARRESGLGEALAAAAGGVVTAEAHAAFERALEHDPQEPKARFLLASALAQEGRIAEAALAWSSMRDSLPADSPWRAPVEAALQEANARLSTPTAPATSPPAPSAPGPDADAVAAAQDMSAADRQQMIEGMVATLDERLRANPDDVEGWQRLIRSYMVLGRTGDAQAALGRAISGLEGESRDKVVAFAAELGVRADGG